MSQLPNAGTWRSGGRKHPIKVTELIDMEEWRQVAARSPYATFFHTPDWYGLFHDTFPGTQIKTRICTFGDGATAVLPMMRIPAGRMRFRYVSGPAGVYGGWIGGEGFGQPNVECLLEHMRHKIPAFTWRLNPFDPHMQKLSMQPFREDFTQVIDLEAGLPAIVKTWTKGHRAAIGQAQRAGVRVECASFVDEWREYFHCYEDSIRRWGARAGSRYSWQFFENLRALGRENVRLWLAKRDSCILAGALCFYHNRHVVYWHGAAYERFFKLRPANLLQYEIIKDAINKKYTWYDFNPSGGHASVVSFKKSFGALARSCPLFRSETSWRRYAGALTRIIGPREREHHVQSD